MGCGSSNAGRIISADDFSPSAKKNPTAITRRESQVQLQKRASRSSLTHQAKPRKSSSSQSHRQPQPRSQSRPAAIPQEASTTEPVRKAHSRSASKASRTSQARSRSGSASSQKSKTDPATSAPPPSKEVTNNEEAASQPPPLNDAEAASSVEVPGKDQADGGMISAIAQIGDSPDDDDDEVKLAAGEELPEVHSSQDPASEEAATRHVDSSTAAVLARATETAQAPAASDQTSPSEDQQPTSTSASEQKPDDVVETKGGQSERMPDHQPAKAPIRLGPAVALDSSRSAHTMSSRDQPAKATRSSHAMISPASDPKPASTELSVVDVPGDECTQAESTSDLLAGDVNAQAAMQQPSGDAKKFTAELAAPQLLAATQSSHNVRSHQAAEDRSTRSSHAIVDLTRTPAAQDTSQTQPSANVGPHDDTQRTMETATPSASDAAVPTRFVATLDAPQSLQATQSTHQIGTHRLSGDRSTRSGHAIVDLAKTGTSSDAHPAATQPECQDPLAQNAAESPSPEIAPVGFVARLDAAQQLEATQSAQVIGTQPLATNRATRSGHAIVNITGTETSSSSITASEAIPGIQHASEAAEPPAAPSKFVAELAAPQQLQATQSTAAAATQPTAGDSGARSMHAFVDLSKSKSPAAVQAAVDKSAPPPQATTAEASEVQNVSVAASAPAVKTAVCLGPEETLLTSRSAVIVHQVSPLSGDRSTASSSGFLDTTPAKSSLSRAAEPALIRSTDLLPTGDPVPQEAKEVSDETTAAPAAGPTDTAEDAVETQESASSRLGAPETLLSSQSTTVAVRALAKDDRSIRSSSATVDVTKNAPAASPSAKTEPECDREKGVAAEPAAEASSDYSPETAETSVTQQSSPATKAVPSGQLGEPEVLLSSRSSATVVRHNLKKNDASTRSSGPSFNSTKDSAAHPSQPVDNGGAQPETTPATAVDNGGEAQESASSDQPTQTSDKPATHVRELDPPQNLLASTSTVLAKGSALQREDRSTRSSIAAVAPVALPADHERQGKGKDGGPLDTVAAPDKDPASGECPVAVKQASKASESRETSQTEEALPPASASPAFVAVLEPPQALLSSTSSTSTGVRKEPIPELQSASGHSLKSSPIVAHAVPSIAIQAPSAHSSRQDLRPSKEELAVLTAEEGEHTAAKGGSGTGAANLPEGEQSSVQQKSTAVEAVSAPETSTEEEGSTEASTQLDPSAEGEACQKEEEDTKAGAEKPTTENDNDQQPTEPTEKSEVKTASNDQPPSPLEASTSSPLVSKSSTAVRAKQLALEAQQFKLKSSSASGVPKVDPKQADETITMHRAGTKAAGDAATEESTSPEIKSGAAAANEGTVAAPAITVEPGQNTEENKRPGMRDNAPEKDPSQHVPSSPSDAMAEVASQPTSKKVDESTPEDVSAQRRSPSTGEKKVHANADPAETAAAPSSKPGRSAVSALIEADREVKITSKSMSAMARNTGEDSDEEGKPLDLKEASVAVIGGSTSNMAKAATSGRPLKTAAKRSGSKGSVRSTTSKSSLKSASRSSATASQHSLRSKSKTQVT